MKLYYSVSECIKSRKFPTAAKILIQWSHPFESSRQNSSKPASLSMLSFLAVEEAVDLVVSTLCFTFTSYGFVQLMASQLLTVLMSSGAAFHAVENGKLLLFTCFAFASHQTRNVPLPDQICKHHKQILD